MIFSKKDLRDYINHDRKVNGHDKNLSLKGWIKELLFPDLIWAYIKTLRKLEYFTNCPNILNRIQWIYTKYKYRKLSVKLGFSIPINVCDSGLSLPHYGTIVISNHAKIGKNCRIHAGVNIGANAGKMQAATIGDNVYIGPGVIIIGDINIPSFTTIGANATVTKNFYEEFTVIVGTPAVMLKKDYPDWTKLILK